MKRQEIQKILPPPWYLPEWTEHWRFPLLLIAFEVDWYLTAQPIETKDMEVV